MANDDLKIKITIDTDTKQVIVARNEVNKLGSSLLGTDTAANGLKNSLRSAVYSAAGLIGVSIGIKELASSFIKTSDAMKDLDGRLRLATSSLGEYKKQQIALMGVANSSFSRISDVTNLYIKMSQGLKQVGFATDDITRVTNNFTKALQLGGATAEESSSAILQFSQAMGSGVLRGEEFNAVNEASPKLMQYLADSISVPIGALRNLAAEGKLTSDIVANALLKAGDAINADFANMPITVSRSLTLVKNELADLTKNVDKELDITGFLSDKFKNFSGMLSENKESITAFFGFIGENKGTLGVLAIALTTNALKAKLFSAALKLLNVDAMSSNRTFRQMSIEQKALVVATNSARNAFIALKVALSSFLPAAAIGGAIMGISMLMDHFDKAKTSAQSFNNALSMTRSELEKLSHASVSNALIGAKNELKDLQEEFNDLNRDLRLNYKFNYLGNGKAIPTKFANNDDIVEKAARMDELAKKIKEIYNLQNDLNLLKSQKSSEKNSSEAERQALNEQYKQVTALGEKYKDVKIPVELEEQLKAVNADLKKINELKDTGADIGDTLDKAKAKKAELEKKIAEEQKKSQEESKKAREDAKRANAVYLEDKAAYYKTIKDYANANAIELLKYEKELNEKVQKGNLTKLEKATALNAKKIELEKATAAEIKRINEDAINDELNKLDENIELYKITAQYEKMAAEQKKKARLEAQEFIKKYKNLSQKEISEIYKFYELEAARKADSAVDKFKNSFEEIKDSWNVTVSAMGKNIEDNLFDFITGKTTSLNNAFRQMGKEMFASFISPYARSFSSSAAGLFTGLLGGGNGGVASFANSYGLELKNGVYSGDIKGSRVEILSDGTVKSGGNVLGEILNVGSSVTSIANLANGSTLSGLSGLFNGGAGLSLGGLQSSLVGSLYSPFGFLANGATSLGMGGLGSGIASFGGGFANAFGLNSLAFNGFGSAFGGGIATGLGSLAGGAALGGLGGFLGDKLFGTQTKATQIGALGGAIGTAILPGIGTAVGSVLGSLVGGAFGTWKQHDYGVYLGQNLNANSNSSFSSTDIQKYVDSEKKSWFGSKSKTDLSALDDAALKSINSAISKVSFLLKDFSGGEFNLPARKYNKNTFYDEALGGAIISSVTGKEYNKALDFGNPGELEAIWRNWEAVAKDASKSVFEVLSEAAAEVSGTMQTLKIASFNSDLEKLKYQSNYALDSFKALGAGLLETSNNIKDIAQISAEDIKNAYQNAIKADFSKETISAFNELVNAYNSATSAQKAYSDALKSFVETAYNALISIKSAYGDSVETLSLDAISAQWGLLNTELKGLFPTIQAAAQAFRNMSNADMAEFLKADTDLKNSLIASTAKYITYANNANANLQKEFENYKTTVANANAQILRLQKEKEKSSLEATIKNYEASKAIYQKLTDIASDLKFKIYDKAEINAVYSNSLQKVKSDLTNGEYNSANLDELQKSALAKAENLKNSSISAEQYRFEVLKMANQIENIAPKDFRQSVEDSLNAANKQLKKLEDALGENSDAQINVLKESISSATTNFASLMSQNAGLFATLGGSFAENFNAILKEFQNVNKANSNLVLNTGQIQAPSSSSSKTVTANGAVLTNPKDFEVNSYYQQILGRSAEDAGLRYWSDSHLNGAELKAAMEYAVWRETGTTDKETLRRIQEKQGLKMFADGGIVTRPTAAMIGEAGYPEAVIPLQGGRGVKVDMDGAFTEVVSELKALKEELRAIKQNGVYNNRFLNENSDGSALLVKVV
uniref:tape measure protein n=1 Tax=Campylobacter fetus TaxID=196 RepID=UPI00203A4950